MKLLVIRKKVSLLSVKSVAGPLITVYILGQKALSNFLAVVELIPSGLGIN